MDATAFSVDHPRLARIATTDSGRRPPSRGVEGEGFPPSTDFVCVECGHDLTAGDGAWECQRCGERYPVLRGTPRLLRRALREKLVSDCEVRSAKCEVGARRPASDTGTHSGEEKCPHEPTSHFALRTSQLEAKLRTAASFGFEWQRFSELRPEWERNFLEYMQQRGPEFFSGRKVLDAGCGTGRHAYHAARYGAEVVAVDLSDAIDVAHANTREPGTRERVRVRTIQADIYHLPFPPESFDFIYSIGVLHHLPDPEGAFQNLLRYLKPGGEVQIYLYWWPEDQPIKRTLLQGVNALRSVTTRLPHPVLHTLSYPLAAAVYAGFVLPYRLLRAIPGMTGWAERFPMKQYAGYPFKVCVNDQFDRFSAPIENRYTQTDVLGWLERAGLEEPRVIANWGWLGSGRKPARDARSEA